MLLLLGGRILRNNFGRRIYIITVQLSLLIIVVAGWQQQKQGDTYNKLIQGNKCRLVLSIGRVDGKPIDKVPPSDWAASGARLVLTNLEVEFQANESEDREKLLGTGDQLVVFPTMQPNFVGINGQTTVPIRAGAYNICGASSSSTSSIFDESKKNGNNMKKEFRFYLDFPEGAERNDVIIEAGERLFFTIDCWDGNDSDFRESRERWYANEKELKDLQDLYCKLSSPDSTDFQQSLRLRSLVMMEERIKILEKEQDDLDLQLPKRRIIRQNNDYISNINEDDNEDVIRGPTGILFSNQDGYISIKRKSNSIFNFMQQEEYNIIGTFTICDLQKQSL